MNYQRIYNELITHRKSNTLHDGEYGEWHHIIPKCMGGRNDANNLVKLKAREHFVAHRLLWLIHRTKQMAFALHRMAYTKNNGGLKLTARQYESVRKANSYATSGKNNPFYGKRHPKELQEKMSKKLSESLKGENNPFYGKRHNDETKRKISIAKRGRQQTQEQRDKTSKALKGKPKSAEHAAKIGRKGMIMLRNINTNECIRVKKEDAIGYDKSIWVAPTKSQRREKCMYCGCESTVGNINRWHNGNCKQKIMGVSTSR